MLLSTLLVIMMAIPGLALFYGGLVRSKNMLSVLMQVFVTFSMIVVLWVVYGYSLAFTEGNAYFGGLDRLMMKGVWDNAAGTFTNAATFSKGVYIPERIKFSAVLMFMRSGSPSATRRSPTWSGTGWAPTPTPRPAWSTR